MVLHGGKSYLASWGVVMAIATQPVKVARRRRGQKRAGLVLAGHGQGWSLWVPVDQWDRLTDAQRLDLANRQAVLLDGRG